jgi:hypothetical protein
VADAAAASPPGRRVTEISWAVGAGAPAWLASFYVSEHVRLANWADCDASTSALAAVVPAAFVAIAVGAYMGHQYQAAPPRARIALRWIGLALVATAIWQFLKTVVH